MSLPYFVHWIALWKDSMARHNPRTSFQPWDKEVGSRDSWSSTCICCPRADVHCSSIGEANCAFTCLRYSISTWQNWTSFAVVDCNGEGVHETLLSWIYKFKDIRYRFRGVFVESQEMCYQSYSWGVPEQDCAFVTYPSILWLLLLEKKKETTVMVGGLRTSFKCLLIV